jgi:hypothetical protein
MAHHEPEQAKPSCYSAMLRRLMARTCQELRVCRQHFNFSKYNYNDADQALMPQLSTNV